MAAHDDNRFEPLAHALVGGRLINVPEPDELAYHRDRRRGGVNRSYWPWRETPVNMSYSEVLLGPGSPLVKCPGQRPGRPRVIHHPNPALAGGE